MDYVIHHIPICPFSQRVEILLALKGVATDLRFDVVDITKPRDPRLLELSRGTTALPVMEVGDKTPIKESRVILRFADEAMPGPKIRRADPHDHALESLIVQREGGFVATGYRMVMNQDVSQRDSFRDKMLAEYQTLDKVLRDYAPGETFFFDDFGWAETVFTPFFQRFWMLEYYEDFVIPDTAEFQRVRRWKAACMAHPAAQQVTFDQIVKLYYDYALGAGNGALVEGRERSSFVFQPDWADRPMPPRDKYNTCATDAELGLL